jgi:hypothetical protein
MRRKPPSVIVSNDGKVVLMRRQVPSAIYYLDNVKRKRGVVENLLQCTVDQAKARGLPTRDLERQHTQLREVNREFRDLLHRADNTDPKLISRIQFLFDSAIIAAYFLGSSSPDPNSSTGRAGKKRTGKALAARKKDWEEVLEKAIARAFSAASPPDHSPEDKDIIRAVHAEMDTQGIRLPIKDEALRKRIRPHRKRAEFVAKQLTKR